jgi:hypothetical protein
MRERHVLGRRVIGDIKGLRIRLKATGLYWIRRAFARIANIITELSG